MEERVGHAGVWDTAVYIHTSMLGGHFGVQSYSPKNRFGFLIPAELCNTTWGLPALPGSARGSHHHQAPPSITTLGRQIHRSA